MKKHPGTIIIAPRITEKGAVLSTQGAYVFNVSPSANKPEIAIAIKELYKVTPRMIRVVTVPRKMVSTRGTNRKGKTNGGKKAYVFLKKGDVIELA